MLPGRVRVRVNTNFVPKTLEEKDLFKFLGFSDPFRRVGVALSEGGEPESVFLTKLGVAVS